MQKIVYISSFSLLLTVVFGCVGQNNEKSQEGSRPKSEDEFSARKSDSIELTNLIRQVYNWHMNHPIDDFPYLYEGQQDSIFTGIDWNKYQKNMDLFKQTGFFSQVFLQQHKAIAMSIDSSIRKADISWRNINDGIPIWVTGADDWCNCQDYPEEYWKFMTLNDLTITNNLASFRWEWNQEYNISYKVTAIKEAGKWKIHTLEGFRNDYTVEYFDEIMEN